MQEWLSCYRCQHRWRRRKMGSLPVLCPRCHAPGWNTPRRQPKEQPIATPEPLAEIMPTELPAPLPPEAAEAPAPPPVEQSSEREHDEPEGELDIPESNIAVVHRAEPETHAAGCDCTACLLWGGFLK